MSDLNADRDRSSHHALRHALVGRLVKLRLVEAFEIEAKLPEVRGPKRNAGSAWPTMTREFEDIVGWSDERRQDVWQDWERAKGAFPQEVTRMDEAMLWLEILKTIQASSGV